MTEFYHQLVADKSLRLLQDLQRRFNFILIGGWAIYLYTKALKSKDIDIVVEFEELGKLKKELSIFKNERLKKYQAKIEEIDVDIYVPFFSNLGFPLEELKNFIQSVENFKVPLPEILLIFKTKTYLERKGTIKGEKDFIDIFSLLAQKKIQWERYKKLIEKYNLSQLNQGLKNLITNAKPIPELGLSEHLLAKLKKEVLKNLEETH